jgi:hypothetical protein
MRRKDIGFLPFVDEWVDFGGDELLEEAARFVVVGGEEHFILSSFRGAREASEPGSSICFLNL